MSRSVVEIVDIRVRVGVVDVVVNGNRIIVAHKKMNGVCRADTNPFTSFIIIEEGAEVRLNRSEHTHILKRLTITRRRERQRC